MTGSHKTVESLADEVIQSLSTTGSALIYASNTTGKTRLAQHLKNANPDAVVVYNSFVEDVFSWDNDRVILRMDPESEVFDTIVNQGLDGSIIHNFRAFTSERIEPSIDFTTGEVAFVIPGETNDDLNTPKTIKISRAEESMFIWSVFYSILEEAIATLGDDADSRPTNAYDNLEIAVIDDPVSSMDDVRVISVALALSELINRASGTNLRFVIATHHALFFNVLFNSLRSKQSNKHKAYVLSRVIGNEWKLIRQPNDAPFSYHLEIIKNINRAILDDAIGRAHFNQFRTLLEKTATFLGHTGGWSALLAGNDSGLMTRILNLYSHDRFADIDYFEISADYKEAFQSEFEGFLEAYKWAVPA